VRVHEHGTITPYDATGSHPSTSTTCSGLNPAMVFEIDECGVCTSRGTEIAYSLSSIRKTIGSSITHAVVSASQNSPSDVDPSPPVQSTTSSLWNPPPSAARTSSWSRAFAIASAQPTAWRYCVAIGDDAETSR
jgi:hypothetical protein